MSKFEAFMSKNKRTRKNGFFPASKEFMDKDGKPIDWEVRFIDTTTQREMQKDVMNVEIDRDNPDAPIKVDTSSFTLRLATQATVFPDLHNAELQDSYGVKTPEALIVALLDDPDEFGAYITFINKFTGLDESLGDKVDQAKN